MPENESNIIYGKNAVAEAIAAHKSIDTLYVSKTAKNMGKLVYNAKENGAVIKDVNDEKLDRLTENGRHGGIAALIMIEEYASVDDILELAGEKGEPPFIIMADEIEDPHNLGALIRTAEAAGAHGLIIPKRRSATLNSTVHHVSAGAASWLKIARVSNLAETLEKLKKENVWVYGADMDGEHYRKVNFSGGVCLVIGSEGKGLGRLIKERCDQIVSIDMYGEINSLNASVSGAILMYEVVRSRKT